MSTCSRGRPEQAIGASRAEMSLASPTVLKFLLTSVPKLQVETLGPVTSGETSIGRAHERLVPLLVAERRQMSVEDIWLLQYWTIEIIFIYCVDAAVNFGITAPAMRAPGLPGPEGSG